MLKHVAVVIQLLVVSTTSVNAMDRYVSYLLNHNANPPQLLRLTFSCESETSCWSEGPQEIATLDPAVHHLTCAPRGTCHALNSNDNTLLTLDITNGEILEATPLAENIDPSSLLAFDDHNRPWVLVDETLSRIDLETGATVQQTELDTPLQAMVFHHDELLAADETKILKIDADSAEIEELADHSSFWGAAWVLGFASDSQLVWAFVDSAAEPGPATHYALMRVDPATGDLMTGSTVAYFQRSDFDCQGLSVRNLEERPDHARGESLATTVLD